MNNSSTRRPLWRAALLSTCLALVAGLAPPGQAAEPAETVRAEIGKPVQAAQALIKQGKFKEALGKLREADGVADRTPYENYALEYTRLSAANSAGDLATASKAFEALAASGRLPPATQQQLCLALASQYYRAGSYKEALAWTQRYQQLGGHLVEDAQVVGGMSSQGIFQFLGHQLTVAGLFQCKVQICRQLFRHER